MNPVFGLAPLLIFMPFMGMFLNMMWGRKLMPESTSRAPGVLATLASGTSFVVGVVLLFALLGNPEPVDVHVFTWFSIPIGERVLEVPWALRVDTLSAVMVMVVAGVGTVIHVFAIEYMHGDIDEQVHLRGLHGEEAYEFKARRYSRFFTYFGFFLGAMLVLVTANNYLMLFVGWELVGLASFLLIGFWYDAPGKALYNSFAAKKAFIANRVGDFGMLMAIMLIFWTFGSLEFGTVFARAECMKTESQSVCLEKSADEIVIPGGEHEGEEGEGHSTKFFGLARMLFQEDDHAEEAHGPYATEIELGPFSPSLTLVVTVMTLFLLLGAAGKSAQIPLFVWLPDAMAGPTPVSALMHAATMVTAGIYLLTRSNELLYIAPFSANMVAYIGGATALVAATIAVAQYDIKRVLAFSTISQLGFMIAAVGVGGYVAAMFHLVTHAFFKALLFLGSGSVIHGIEHGHHHAHHLHEQHGHDHGHDDHGHEEHFDPQDMRVMGGLRDKMPVTTWVYIIGALALAGIPPLAGFWSKDEILADSQLTIFPVYIMLTIAAFFTAFYMGRQVFLVFFGKPRHEAAEYTVESPPVMTIPLIILAALAVVGGFMNLPFEGGHQFAHFLEEGVRFAHAGEFIPRVALVSTVLALIAIVLAYGIYGRDPVEEGETDPLEEGAAPAFNFLLNRWYWDDVYHTIFVAPYIMLGDLFANTIDWNFWHDFFHDSILGGAYRGLAEFWSKPVEFGLIDGAVNGIANLIGGSSSRLRHVQTGYVRNYALAIGIGVLIVVGYLAFRFLA